MENIKTSLASRDAGRLFAVIHVDGIQRKVTTEDIVVVRKHLEADIGERIRLNKVIAIKSSFNLSKPEV